MESLWNGGSKMEMAILLRLSFFLQIVRLMLSWNDTGEKRAGQLLAESIR
jgi:hypothetical protein